jgi:putative membrane protein
MRKYTILATTVLMSGMVFAQAPATGSGTDTNSAATATHENSKPAAGKTGTKKMDDMFAKNAAEGGMAEVELGKLAADKATNEDVKAFGKRMVDDHTKAGDQLKGIAAKENIQLPTELNAKDKAQKDRLSKLSGEAFDRAYINHMVMDHKQDVADFQKEANNGQDDAIKNFAQQTLPTLQDHLKQAQDAQIKVRGAKATTSTKKDAATQ